MNVVQARINDHLAHFNYEEEMDISLTSDFSMTQRPPTQLRSSSSAVTVPFPSGSSVESTINQEISISTKYRSTNSKRVAEFVTTKFATNSTEIDETISRKRQFTEKIFKMWMYEVREDVLASKRNT